MNAQLSQDHAETIALQVLAWLAGHDALFDVFLGSTGASAEDVARRAQDADFLASVLGFVVMDDAWVLEFSGHSGLAPDLPIRALQALPGAEQVHWT